MTTSVLEALIQLFALFAAGRGKEGIAMGRRHASRHMQRQMPKMHLEDSLQRFDELVNVFQTMPGQGEDMMAKRLSKLSVKLLRTCAQINKGLELHEKHIVVIRLLEFLRELPDPETGQAFLRTVVDTFNMEDDTYQAMQLLVNRVDDLDDSASGTFILTQEALEGRFGGMVAGLHMEEQNLFLLRAGGDHELRINHEPVPTNSVVMLAPGGSVRDGLGSTLFHSELVTLLNAQNGEKAPWAFQVHNLSHWFRSPKSQALHQFSFEARAGQLVGIMGGSGSGKSTLLSILNGSMRPTFGSVKLMDVDIHNAPEGVAGLIGHVPQEDVLVEELTVRENLTFNAKLSLSHLSENDQLARVDEVLQQLGLWETRDLRVGSVLDKVISGGQRKRLNIGLELLRKPEVLFLDEPTSGLSSRDSAQIMDILKELTYAGQLVFAVLHQPSSDLFKMLDRLFMLDVGGHPVYWGNPLNAVRHFNELASRVHDDQCECASCGNVNPEQIFDILEARTVDEFGRKTDVRRTTPQEWSDFYTVLLEQEPVTADVETPAVTPSTQAASGWTQWTTFLSRDIVTKWRNKQYLWVNLLEAPALAMLLAGFMRFALADADYTFRASENVPPFLFISVIVALFLGLSVSAEEILRDRTLLKREQFLQVKWHNFVHAKLTVVAVVSVVHSLGFVLVSHAILDIPGFVLTHTLVLFAVAFFGNVLGLLISALCNTAKVIYIVIPLLVIPQIIFGGAIIRFERFNPAFTQADAVPWFGNVMASRWGFEALAVDLARNNAYDKTLMPWEDRLHQAAWRRDFWLAELRKVEDPDLLVSELSYAQDELSRWEGSPFAWPFEMLSQPDWDVVKDVYNNHYQAAFRARNKVRAGLADAADLVSLKGNHHNDELWSWVLQDDRMERVLEAEGILVQKSGPIHRLDARSEAFDSTMYTPFKKLGGTMVPTLVFNVLALMGMAALVWAGLLMQPRISGLLKSPQA